MGDLGHLLKAIGDLDKHAFAQCHGAIENPGKLALRLTHKVIKGPDNGGIEVPDQNLDQRIAQHNLARPTHFLTHQKQHRTKAHPRCCHGGRDWHHPDQINAEAYPIQKLTLRTFREGGDVIQRIDQRHDVAHHRQKPGRAFDSLERDNPATDLLQPGVNVGRTRANVF